MSLFSCLDCGGIPSAPILEDALWLSIAPAQALLCTHCVERRLGRRLEITDLKMVPMNHFLFIYDERIKRGNPPDA